MTTPEADGGLTMRGIRTRLAITLVVLVALTVAAIGIGVYAFVEASLRDRLLADARHQADFNLSVLLPAEVPLPTDAASFAASGLPEAFKLRGDVDTIADFGDGNPYTPAGLSAPWTSCRRTCASSSARASSAMRGRRCRASRCWWSAAGRGRARPVLRVPGRATWRRRSRSSGWGWSRRGCSPSSSR